MTGLMTMMWTEQDKQSVWCVCTGDRGATQIWAASPPGQRLLFDTDQLDSVYPFLEYFCFVPPPPTQPLKGCRAKRIFALQRGAGGPRVLTDGRIPLRPPDSAFVPEIAHLCLTSGSQRKLSRRGWSLRRSEKGFGTNPSYCVSSLKPPKM